MTMAQFTYDILGRTATIEVHGVVADTYRQTPGYTEVLAAEDVEALKGDELNAQLEARGLPTGGKVADRRERLLEATANPVHDPQAALEGQEATPVEDVANVAVLHAGAKPTTSEEK
jgi:hypothetical protein